MEGADKKYNNSFSPKKSRKERNRRNRSRTDRNHKTSWVTTPNISYNTYKRT